MTNIAEEFIKSKGLDEEYRAYVQQRENRNTYWKSSVSILNVHGGASR